MSREQPFLSVLVPVYNWDVASLAQALSRELAEAGLAGRVELVFMDDASPDARRRAANQAALARAGDTFRYEALSANLGRAAIRNRLVERARGEYLLFLDADVLPDAADFLRRYLDCLQSGDWDVVCGGISYRTRTMTDAAYDFYLYLSRRTDVKPAQTRKRHPGRHVLTSNLAVRRSLLATQPFDPRFEGYGYEDVEWGLRVERAGRILHIDNPVSHLGLVTKGQVYERMRLSMENYRLLIACHPDFFRHSEIRPFVRFFARFNGRVLQALAAGLRQVYFHAPPPLAFYAFQLSKAVLLAQAMRMKPVEHVP